MTYTPANPLRRAVLCTALLFGAALAAQTSDPLYDKSRLRDLHFTFTQSNWWAQLDASGNTRIPVRGDLRIDGKTYPDIGLHIKGNSSKYVPSRKQPFKELNAFAISYQVWTASSTGSWLLVRR